MTLPPTLEAVAGAQVVDAVVARFNDRDAGAKAGDYQVTIQWGDGTSSAGVVLQDANDPTLFCVLGSHHYSATGHFTVTSSIVDSGGTSTIMGWQMPVPVLLGNLDRANNLFVPLPPNITITTTFLTEAPVTTTTVA